MLSRLSQRARMALLGVLGSTAAFFVFGGFARLGGAPPRPLDAVPPDAFLIATADMAELRRSPLYALFFDANGPRAERGAAVLGARALGVSSLRAACGFDPLSRVEELALAVPEGGERGDFGIAARVGVSPSELSRCTSALARARGEALTARGDGRFTVIEGASRENGSPARIAYGRGGLLVVGHGTWFDAMIATADGRAPSVEDVSATHAALRASITAREGWRTPSLLATLIVPSTLRERVRSEMRSELSSDGADPHRAAAEDRAMDGVLGVSAAAVALRAGPRGGSIDLMVELACDTEQACSAVEQLLLEQRLRWSKELGLRLIGFGPLLDSIDVKRDGTRVRVTASTPADRLGGALDRVLRQSARPVPDAPPEPVRRAHAD